MTAYVALLALVALYLAAREGRWISVTAMLLGALLVLYGGGHLYYYERGEIDDRVSDRVTLALSLMWVGLIAGVELVRALAPTAQRRRARMLHSWEVSPLELWQGDSALWQLLALALVFYLATMFVVLGKAQQIVAFIALDSELAKREFRLAVGSEGGYFFRLVLTTVAPLVALYSAVFAWATRRRFDLVLASALVVLVLLFKIGSFHKAQWVWFVVQLLLAFRLMYSARANVGWMLVGAGIFVAALLLGAQFAFPDLDILGLWGYLTYRVFEITNEGLYQFVYVYPEYISHAHGMNVGALHALFAEGGFVPAHTRVAQFFGSMDATNNAVFIADAWVDFAYAGVFGVSTIIGAVVKAVDLYAGALGKTPASIALTAYAFFSVVTLSSTSAFTTLLTGGLASVPLFVFLVRSTAAWLRRSLAAVECGDVGAGQSQ